MSTPSTAELDALIDELIVDCYNDEEQLTGLLTGAEEALVVGETATIARAEIRVMAVDCPSDLRRGLTAVCERDGYRFELSLADIRFGDAWADRWCVSPLARLQPASHRRLTNCELVEGQAQQGRVHATGIRPTGITSAPGRCRNPRPSCAVRADDVL